MASKLRHMQLNRLHYDATGSLRDLWDDEGDHVDRAVRERSFARFCEVRWPSLGHDGLQALAEAYACSLESERFPAHRDPVHHPVLVARGLIDPDTGWPTVVPSTEELSLMEDNAHYLAARRASKRERLRKLRQ
jgi:hypothetical protein